MAANINISQFKNFLPTKNLKSIFNTDLYKYIEL